MFFVSPSWIGECCICERIPRFAHQASAAWTALKPIARRPPGALYGEGAIMAHAASLPVLTAEGGLSRYLEEIRRFPMLEPQEEYMLAKSWREHGDRESAHKLVTSHLRLV